MTIENEGLEHQLRDSIPGSLVGDVLYYKASTLNAMEVVAYCLICQGCI